MDNRRENWTSEELTINNTTSAASIRHFSLPILQDFPPLSDFSVSNNSAALSSVTKNSQSHSVDVFTRPHFEGSHLTPGSTIPPQLPMDNTRESQTIDESTLNNMTYTFGLEDVPLLNDNSNASACLGSERSSTSLSRVYDSSQSPGMSILPSFDFRIRPRLTSGVNIPPQLPLEIGTESQTRETPTVNGITTSFGPVGVPLVHNSTASACLSSSSRGYDCSSSPGLCFLPQSHSRGSGLTSSVNIPPQFPMNDRRDIQTVEDSAVTNMTMIFGPGDLPLSKENSPGLAFVPQNSALTRLSKVTEYSQSPGMNFSLRSDFNSSPGMNIPSQLPIDYTGYAEGESIVNNMTGVYSSYFPLSQDIFTPSTSFEQFSSSASSRNVHYSLSPSVPFLTGPDARSLQNTFGVNRSQQSPMDNGRESQTLGESSVNTSTVLSRPVNIPARPAVPLLRRVSAPRREFHPVLSNKFPWSRVGGGSNSGKRMQLIRPGFMNVDRNNQVPCSNIPAPRTPLVNSVQTHSNSATSSVPLGERKRRISPGCHIQDPKQPKVTSVDMAVKQGSPTDDELEELGNEIGEKWIKLGRRLGAKEPKLQDIEQRHNQLCERGYHMLMDWKQENGSAATYVTLNAALQHELVQRKDLAEKICYKNVSAVNSFDLKTCQRKLAEHYQRTAKIPTTVWSSICQVNLDKIYTRLSWVKREETVTGSSPKEMGHYTEMFAEKSGSGAPPKKRILVQGDTGIGKTTFVKKMLVDLSNLEEAKLDEEQKNALRRFDLVLAVDLKEVSQCRTLTEVLRGSRLFPRDDGKFFDDLNSYILKNQERVLLLFDGYDEYRTGSEAEQYGSRSDSPVSQIFHRTILSYCTVMVTTRSSRADELRGSADIQAEVTGFSELDRKDFMMKMLKSKTEVDRLRIFLRLRGMLDLVRVPLLNLFFCLLWREEKNELKNGTKSKTNLYQAIVRFILRHSHRKHSPTQAFMVKVDNYEDILDEIGKVALEGLLRGELVFEYGELSAAVRGDKSVLAGLLQLSEYGPSVEPKGMVSFIHKSIQEYLAAWYVTNRCVPEGNLGGMEEHARTLVRCEELENVFHFVCGLSDDGAVKILEHLKSLRISNPELDYSKTISDIEKETCESLPLITDNQDNFNDLVYCCFDEVQSKAKLLDLCLDCVGRLVLVNGRTIKFLQEWDGDIQLMHSEVKFLIREEFDHFMGDNVNYARLLLEVFDGGGSVLQVTESGNPFTLRDFIVGCYEVFQCDCSFTSILSLHNGRFQFHIVELTLTCGHHTKLLTRTTASCAQSRSRDLSSAESCLYFLRDLRCYFCGESVQLFDEFCDLLQSVPNPNKCLLNVGRLGPDAHDDVKSGYRLTTAEAEKLARALLPFTRIKSVALNVSNCSAAAVETLVTGINRKTVEELELHGITLTSAVAAALRRSLPETSSLQELSLTEMNVSNLQAEEGSALFDVFLQMKSILWGNFSLRGWPAPLSTIPQYILNLNLKIYDINTDEGNLVGFFESLRFIPRLNHLVLPSLTCTGSSEQGDVDASSSISERLTLAGINLTPAVAAALSQSLANMSSLQCLSLAGKNEKDVVNLDAKVMEALVGEFEKVLPLTHLQFSGFSVRGCLAPLAKSLRFFPGLNSLSLTSLNLDELDLNCLLENFEFIPLLGWLHLSRTPLGDAVRSILPYVINLSNLHFLLICETSSDEHLNYVKEAIRQARPDITVYI